MHNGAKPRPGMEFRPRLRHCAKFDLPLRPRWCGLYWRRRPRPPGHDPEPSALAVLSRRRHRRHQCALRLAVPGRPRRSIPPPSRCSASRPSRRRSPPRAPTLNGGTATGGRGRRLPARPSARPPHSPIIAGPFPRRLRGALGTNACGSSTISPPSPVRCRVWAPTRSAPRPRFTAAAPGAQRTLAVLGPGTGRGVAAVPTPRDGVAVLGRGRARQLRRRRGRGSCHPGAAPRAARSRLGSAC